ncbi:unnamed protein product [Prunus brigantina]
MEEVEVAEMGTNPMMIPPTKTLMIPALWHLRYGHLNFRGLKMLHDKEMVTGLPQITCPTEVCEVCVVGKQHRETFPKGKAWRARKPLELVHSDICGPITPASNAGKRYFITFIDDYSRKTWVYFLQEKLEALNAFKHFKAAAENEIEKTIKTKSCIPKSFWPEAVNWGIHILNKSPTFAIRDLTPEEAWSGRKPAVGYFKVFGCIAYAHILDEKKNKLDDKDSEWVFDSVSGSEGSDDDPLVQFALFAYSDPVLFSDAAREPKWQKAMDEEIKSIEKNNTWELTELPQGHKTIGVKWVFKTKLNEKGEIYKHKARLVVKGYKQEYGVDYTELFAPPAGYVQPGKEKQVYRLKKALYGLKQAPRAWYSRIGAYFAREGFRKCPYEHTLFTKSGEEGQILIVCLYVYDLIYTGNDVAMFNDFKKSMMHEFGMSDLGLMHYFLGIEVVQSSAGIFISQKKYVQEILDRFEMKDCNSVCTPTEIVLKLVKNSGEKKVDQTLYKQIVGSLMYLTATRPDIQHAIVTLSTTEAEFIAAAAYGCQAIWLRRILEELRGLQEGPTPIYCDNNSAIKFSKNPVLHGRSKHIDVHYHFLRDLTKGETIDLIYCRSEDQVADILTKPLKLPAFSKLRKLLGVCSVKDIA